MCLSNDRGKLVIMQNYNRYQTHMQDHLVFSQHFDLNTNFRRYIIFVGEIANRFGSGACNWGSGYSRITNWRQRRYDMVTSPRGLNVCEM